MPSDLTIFAASYLVFIEAIIALAIVAYVLYRRPRIEMLEWAPAAVITAVLAEVFTQIGTAVYNDPRPFAVSHFHPLIAHAADNGFPSDHALLAAFLVACVLFARAWLVAPFVALLAILVDWARVGAGIHHVTDVVGSTVFVALAAALAFWATPFVVRWVAPRLPPAMLGEDASVQAQDLHTLP